MNKKHKLDLTEGTIWRVLIAFVLPIMAGSLIQQLYITVDAVVVGKFAGKEGLAAIDSVYTLFKFPINFMNGLSSGATIVISRYFGGKNEKELDCATHTAYTVAIGMGAICSIVGFLLTPSLLHIMNVPEEIYASTLLYCRIYFGGLWTMILYNMVAGILRAYGNTRSPLFILIVCCIVNVAGDLLLVGGLHLGVAGAAAATIAAQLVSAILAMKALGKTHEDCSESVWRVHFCTEHTGEIIKLGFPLGLQALLFPVANSIIHASINSMGTNVIAAWAVGEKLDMIIWLVADSMAPALSTYVAQNLGAKKQDRVGKGVAIGNGISVGLVALFSLILFFFGGPLGSLFVTAQDAPVLVPMIAHYMRMMGPFFIFYAIGEGFSGAFCGYGETVKSMLVTMTCTCGLRVLCIFTILPHFYQVECIIWIYIASWIVTGVVFSAVYYGKAKRVAA